MSSGVSYVLQRLSDLSNEEDPTFNEEQWNFLYEKLESESLSPEQSNSLVNHLIGLARMRPDGSATSAVFPALKALSQCMEERSEVKEFFKHFISPTDERVVTFYKSLGLSEYLGSEALYNELLYAGDDQYLQLSDLNPRLSLLFHLHVNCSAFSTFENLDVIGLSAKNKQYLELFFAKKQENLPDLHATGVVDQALTNIKANTITHIKYREVLDKVKRKDFVSFTTLFEDLVSLLRDDLHKQKVRFMTRVQGQPGVDTNRIAHQEQVIVGLENLKETFASCLLFFAEKELPEGIKLIDKFMPIHYQTVQVCDNSVALIFIGLIKTGKSTIVDTIIGENVSPSRTDPMTAVPVRYIHDPNANEPVMLVPFYHQLNKVVRLLHLQIEQRGLKKIKDDLKYSHLRNLVDKISNGLIFRHVYKGPEEVLEASISLHDLFRLAVQDVFPPDLAKELPLDWGQGLDSFLTVTVKFPNSESISSEVKLSVIDTPGVNEDGVKKLELNKVINDSVEVCHYVAFTVNPRNNDAKDNTRLKRLLMQINNHSKTPTLVLATNRDSLKEKKEEIEECQHNIANTLREGNQSYPPSSVYVISGKRKLLGEKMKQFILKNNRKPALDDADPVAARLAEDWALFAAFGDSEEEKKENYDETSKQKILERSEKLIVNSFLNEPMNLMISTSTVNAAYLSCNKAIEKSLECSKNVSDFLSRIMQAYQADANHAQNLIEICEEVHKNISDSVVRIRADMNRNLSQFRRVLRADVDKTRATFEQKLSTLIDPLDNWQFTTRQDAETKVSETLRIIQQNFTEDLDKVLEEKQTELEKLVDDVRQTVQQNIFNELMRIATEVQRDTQAFAPQLPKVELALDSTSLGYNANVVSSQEKATSLTGKISNLMHGRKFNTTQEIFNVELETVREEAIATLKEYTSKMSGTAGQRIERSTNKILDDLFLQALRKVNQIREALSQRGRLITESARVDELYHNVRSAEINLERLLKEIPK